jgi:hypothetical protein
MIADLDTIKGEQMKEESKKKIDEKKIEKIQKGEGCDIEDIPHGNKVKGKPGDKDLKKIQNSK